MSEYNPTCPICGGTLCRVQFKPEQHGPTFETERCHTCSYRVSLHPDPETAAADNALFRQLAGGA